jgi:hypothetical protein
MNDWKYTNDSNTVVARTNADGSYESRLVSAIADWIAEGNTPEPAEALDPRVVIIDQITALEAQITPRRIREALLLGDMSFIATLDEQIAQLRLQL